MGFDLPCRIRKGDERMIYLYMFVAGFVMYALWRIQQYLSEIADDMNRISIAFERTATSIENSEKRRMANLGW